MRDFLNDLQKRHHLVSTNLELPQTLTLTLSKTPNEKIKQLVYKGGNFIHIQNTEIIAYVTTSQTLTHLYNILNAIWETELPLEKKTQLLEDYTDLQTVLQTTGYTTHINWTNNKLFDFIAFLEEIKL